MAQMKATLKSLEVRSATTRQVEVSVSYTYVPRGGKNPLPGSQLIELKLWEKGPHKRLYMDTQKERLGYWDLHREVWGQSGPRQEIFYGEVVPAVVKAAMDAMDEEAAREEKIRARYSK